MTDSYQVRFTDYQNKGALTVEEKSINSSTSLTFPGRDVVGYGQLIAENFLHLLENFSSPTSPVAPVQGQLWFNTTENQLYIFDGTQWGPAGGLKRGAEPPSSQISLMGDLWVNTNTQQLFLFTGSDWTLVGPTFSSGTKSGTHAEEIIDANDITQVVISHYINNERVAIISTAEFTPKATIAGFSTIYKGVTLNSNVGIYNGVSQTAKTLLLGSSQIPATSFLRNDTINNIQETVYIRNSNGINIGNDAQISIKLDNTGSAVLSHNTAGSRFYVKLNNGLSSLNIVTVDSSGKVGINNTSPQENLDVVGNAKISGQLSSNSLTVEDLSAGNITSSGNLITNNISTTGIIPSNTSTNIGSSSQKINKLFVNELSAGTISALTFSGTAFSGTSAKSNELSSPITLSITGDISAPAVSFGTLGTGFSASINATLSSDFVASKDEVVSMQESDMFLISRNISGLKKIKKSSIFASLPQIPTGVLMPYAGSAAPAGWLLCDGTELSQASYPELYSVIGYSFGAPSSLVGINTFRIPDLRGRFPLGLDSMFNNISVPSAAASGASVLTVTSPAGRVTAAEANILGLGNSDLPDLASLGSPGSSTKIISLENLPNHEHSLTGDAGTQYYAVNPEQVAPADSNATLGTGGTSPSSAQLLPTTGSVVGATNTPIDVMNPYLGLNYIIYTGKVI